MATEDLNIRISAIDNTKKAFGAVTKSLNVVKSAVLSAKTAIAALVGAGGFAYLIKSSLNTGDALAKTARKIGTTTEALSRLRYAADLSGVSAQTLDMALQRFTRRTAEAARGTGEAKDAIRELGLDAQALLKMPLEQRMLTLSNAFNNVGTSADQVRLAMKLFDSEGVALVNMLNNGATALNNMMLEADTLGIVLSQSAAEGTERANDALSRLGYLAKGMKDQFSAALAPAIEEAAFQMKEWVLSLVASEGGIKGFAQSVARSFLTAVRNIVTTAASAANKVNNIIRNIGSTLSGDDSMDKLQQQWLDLTNRAEEYKTALIKGNSEQASFVDWFKSLGKETALRGVMMQLSEVQLKMAELKNKGNISQEDLFDVAGIGAAFDGLIDKIGMDGGGNSVNAAINESLGLFQQFRDNAKNMKDSIFDLNSEMQSLISSGVDRVVDGLTDMVSGAKSASQAFKSMASSIIQDLMRMYIKYMIVQPLFNAIAGGLSGYKDTGNIGSQASSYAGIDKNWSGPKANGGSVSAGRGYMVGENGPEYFVPRTNGAVIANRDMQGGGGVTVNQSINISAGVAQTVRAEIMGLMPQITNATKAAVADARMRGGSFSKSLVGA